MENMVVIGILVFILILLKIILNIKLKEIDEITKNEELNELSDTFPENVEICKTILKKLNNTKVKIEEAKDTKTSLYIAISDKISIGNIKDTFTRVQTIAHECIHSTQNRRLLLFNFIYSNIYFLYFIIIIGLTLFGKVHNYMLQTTMLLILGIVYYFVRNLLEMDAMIKAKYLANEYLEENAVCTKKQCEEIINEYEKLNNIGIPAVQYELLLGVIVKIIIYSLIVWIKTVII